MAWLCNSGVKNMATCLMLGHTYSRLPQHFLHTRQFVRSFILHGKQFHNSPVFQSSGLGNFNRLIDQGRNRIMKLKSKDNIPQNYKLIYKASMEFNIRLAYPSLLLCSLGLFGSFIYKMYYAPGEMQPRMPDGDGKMKFLYPEQELWFFSTMLFLLVLGGCSVMFKYPFRIYKHNTEREYIAIYLSPIFPLLKQVKFKTASPTKFKNPFYYFVPDCHYLIEGKKKTLFFSQFFRIPKDLTDMFEETINDR